MKRLFSISILVGFVAASVFAGVFENKFGNDPAALAKDLDYSIMSHGNGSPDGSGRRPYLPALGAPPKRVAMVSFFIWDTGFEKKSKTYSGDFTYSWKESFSVSTTGEQRIATALYQSAIGPMKEGFSAHGMDLLGPEEFLDTPEKKAAYEAFHPAEGGSAKFTKFMTSGLKKYIPEPAVGFQTYEMPINVDIKGKHFEMLLTGGGGGDEKLFSSLGHDLAEILGVDAVLVVYNVLQAEPKTISLLGTYAYMFGPNPVKTEDPKGKNWTGHQYTGVFLRCDVPFIKTDGKGKERENDFAGYGLVAKAIALKTGEYLEEKTKAK